MMVPDGFSQPASHALHIVPARPGAIGDFRAAIINPITRAEHCGRLLDALRRRVFGTRQQQVSTGSITAA